MAVGVHPGAAAAPGAGGRARTVPLRHALAGLFGSGLEALLDIGRWAGGDVVRLGLGPFRPYLLTTAGQVRHVLRDNAGNYRREGMLWRPVRRLTGDGLSGDGPSWAASRQLLQPMFSAARVESLVELTAATVVRAVDELEPAARDGRPVEAGAAMNRIVSRVVIRAFFGDQITVAQADRLGAAIARAFTSLGPRLLLPFVPDAVPLPGTRAFARAVREVDAVMLPLIDRCRAGGATGGDVVSLLCQARAADGSGRTDRQVRDDVVAMFVAGSETASVALTWLWLLLHRHPEASAALSAEVDRVVGAGPVRPAHLPELEYTRMVLQELLRLYPTGWLIPRRAVAADVLAGVRIPAGATVLASPWLIHRSPRAWPDPHAFDPLRFAPGARAGQDRSAYLPFGAGPHQCLGSHFFTVHAQLIVAAMVSRYHPRLVSTRLAEPRAAVTLRPDGPVELLLRPGAAGGPQATGAW